MPYRKLEDQHGGGRKCSICGGRADWECNTSHYCTKHMRLLRMRLTARDRGLAVPTVEALEALVGASNGLRCGSCDTQMVWTRREDTKRVCTLQHNADGSFALWCLVCNIQDGRNTRGDTVRQRFVAGVKRCMACGHAKPRAEFVRISRKILRSAARCLACADALATKRKAGAA